MFHILVVDDDKHTRLLFRTVLESENYTVFTAENGVAGVIDDALTLSEKEGSEKIEETIKNNSREAIEGGKLKAELGSVGWGREDAEM